MVTTSELPSTDGTDAGVLDPDILPPWPAGHRLGRYEIVSDGPIGEGGMGRVYLAVDRELDRSAAIKEMLTPSDREKELTARFLNESALPARVSHPNIITIYERGEQDARKWYAMEYLPGVVSLADRIDEALQEGDLLPINRLVTYLKACLRALCAIHAAGWWHRDIKPDNILISTLLGGGETVKVIDFGIAHDPRQRLTEAWMQPGCPRYVAPESLVLPPNFPIAVPEIDERTDLFALGVTFYEAFSGTHPYENIPVDRPRWRKRAAEIYGSQETLPPPLASQRAGLHSGIEAVVMRLMERHPKDRFQSAREALDELEQYRLARPYQDPRHRKPEAEGSGGGQRAEEDNRLGWLSRLPTRARRPLLAGLLAAATAALVGFLLMRERLEAQVPPRKANLLQAQEEVLGEPSTPHSAKPAESPAPERPGTIEYVAPVPTPGLSSHKASPQSDTPRLNRPSGSTSKQRKGPAQLDPRLFQPGGIVQPAPGENGPRGAEL